MKKNTNTSKVVDLAKTSDNSTFDNDSIEEIEDTEESEGDVPIIEGGKVEAWEPIRIRAYITLSVLSIWALSVFMGLISLIIAGNPLLLVVSSTSSGYPLRKVLDYYFSTNKDKGGRTKRKT